MDGLSLAVRERLESLGYEWKDGDEALLSLVVERIRDEVGSECARTDMPKGLESAAADIAEGEFLRMKYAAGAEDVRELAGSPAVKRIKIGDTETAFAVKDEDPTETALEGLIRYLTERGRRELSCYRKIRW